MHAGTAEPLRVSPPEAVAYLLELSLLKYSEVALADWMDVTITASAYWVNLTFHEMPIRGCLETKSL